MECDKEQVGQTVLLEPNKQEELEHIEEIQRCMDAALSDLESVQTHLFETVKLLRQYEYEQNKELFILMMKILYDMQELAEIRNAY